MESFSKKTENARYPQKQLQFSVLYGQLMFPSQFQIGEGNRIVWKTELVISEYLSQPTQMLISAQEYPSCSHLQNPNRSSSRERFHFIRSTITSEHQHQTTMNGRRYLRRNPEDRVGPIKLRLAVLLLTIQVVLCSQKSPMLSNKRYPIFGRKGTTIQEGIDFRYRHQNNYIRIRGGGKDSQTTHSDTAILSKLLSFFHDNVLPKVKETRESLRQRVDDHIEGQAKQRQEQLERNKRWREAAESIVPTDKVITLSPSFSYASPAGTAKSTSSLPIEVLKLGTAAWIILASLDRAGIFDGDMSKIAKIRIKSFWRTLELIWKDDVLPTYKNARYNLERWYHRHAKPRIFELQAQKIRLEERAELFFLAYPRTSSRIKAISAIVASYGMISTPLLFPFVLRSWKPVLLIAALSELNHSSTATTESLGSILDELLDRYRNLVRSTIFKVIRIGRGGFYKNKGYGRWKGSPRVDQMRRKLSKQGLFLVCSFGLVLIGLI